MRQNHATSNVQMFPLVVKYEYVTYSKKLVFGTIWKKKNVPLINIE